MVVPSRGIDCMLAELHIEDPGVEDESTGKQCGLLAWFCWYGGGCGEDFFRVSASTTTTNISSDATVELAN